MTLIAKKARLTGRLKAGPVKFSAVEIADSDLTLISNAIDAINGEVITGQALDKLAATDASKADIKAAIEAYAVDVDDAPLADYAGLIEDISAGVEATFKSALDAANEEASADLTAGIALVDSNYAAISGAITAAGVDMTGVLPSGYDAKIADAINQTRYIVNPDTGVMGTGGYNRRNALDAVMPDSALGVDITSMNPSAFSGAVMPGPSLKSITFNNLITFISSEAGAYNAELTTVTMPNQIQTIEFSAFRNCAIAEVTLPTSLTHIAAFAFLYSPITKITISANVAITDVGGFPTMGSAGKAFFDLYEGNGRLAGTYEYAAGTWTKTA